MILHRYILREHISPFFYALFIIIFLFVMDFVIQMIDSILSKGLDGWIVLEIFILNLAWMFALAVPMAVLVATLMAYGRLSADNELVALRASGQSLYRMLAAPLVASLCLAGLLIYFNNRILPEANHRASMLFMDISRKRPSAFIKEGFIITDFQGYRIIVGRVDPKGEVLYDVKIYQEGDGKTRTLTFAKRGVLEYINAGEIVRFVLYDGEIHQEEIEKPGNYFRGKFSKQVVYLDNIDDSFRRSGGKTRGDREMSAKMLMEVVRENKSARKKETEQIAKLLPPPPPGAARAPAAGPAAPFDFGKVPPEIFQKVLSAERARSTQLSRLKNLVLSKEEIINKYLVEVHKKYSIPVACLVFVLIGAPLGMMARSTGIAAGVAYSIAFFIVYWIFLIAGESLADRMAIPAWIAMWSPNAVIGGLGLWLTVKLSRETTFLSYGWVKRLRVLFTRRKG